jgi:flagellar FliL protein
MAKQKVNEELDLGIEKENGSKKKWIILISVGVLVLLGGGLGASWFLFGGSEDEQVAMGSAGGKQQVEEKPPAIYQSMEPAFVVNLPPGGRLKMLQVGLQVMARDPALIEFIKHNDPMIRNSLLNLFSAQEGKQLKSREGKEKLQTELLKVLNRLTRNQGGPGEVEAVYFTSFVMQ